MCAYHNIFELMHLYKYLAGRVVTEEKIQEAKVFYQMHFKQTVFDEEGWRKVLEVQTQVHIKVEVSFQIFHNNVTLKSAYFVADAQGDNDHLPSSFS